MFQWLVTGTPLSPTGVPQSWKLHAVQGEDSETLADLRGRESACGLLPRAGWAFDLFIDGKCKRCLRVVGPG